MSSTEAPTLGLSDRASFALLHCGRPMQYRGSRSTWQGKYPEGTSTLENEYRCEGCGATLDFKLVEPDQPPLDSTP
jgi:hypothetical protein